MSSRHVPDLIDPVVMAGKQQQLEGGFELSELSRIKDSLADTSGTVSFQLLFHRDRKNIVISGDVDSVLQLRCQRCMELMQWPVHGDVSLAVVSSMDEADRLPDAYEPVLLTETKIPLKDIVEEELLLALPVIPQHAGDCPSGVEVESSAEPALTVSADDERYQPFANLAELIKSGE